jgi:hypothetical protein
LIFGFPTHRMFTSKFSSKVKPLDNKSFMVSNPIVSFITLPARSFGLKLKTSSSFFLYPQLNSILILDFLFLFIFWCFKKIFFRKI